MTCLVWEKLRENPATEIIPVVLLTALAAAQGEGLGRRLGVHHYITKPCDPETLELTIRVALREARTEAEEREAATKVREGLGYPVSEDLSSSPRGADGFSQPLLEDYKNQLDGKSIGVVYDKPGMVSTLPGATTMGYHDWLPVIRKEYLQGFIKRGGATVKFVIPWEHLEHQVLREELQRASEEDNYIFVSVDAATTRVHMIDKLFNEVARQIAWDDLAHAFLSTTLLDSNYLIPSDKSDFSLSQIADLNGLDLGEMRAIINNRLRERLARAYEMTDDFRMAMLKLCQAQVDPQDLGVGGAEAVREWLWGELKLISGLKSAFIFEKIGRHNGLEILSSLSHWLHLAGKSGLVLNLDISRFLADERLGQPDGPLYYSAEAVVDGYEVLRQFIDSIDELQFCLMVVFAPPSFLTDEQRGVRKYDALYLRIWDEVHGRRTTNPLSPLIGISRQESESPGKRILSLQTLG